MTAGGSNLYGAQGGSLQLFGSNYQARLDAGYLDHPRFGYDIQWRSPGTTWNLGDQNIAFALPTDLFNTAYLFGRGLSAERKTGNSRVFVFTGATSKRFVLPFLDAAQADRPASILFYERQVRPSLKFASQSMMASRQTSIETLQWTPAEALLLAAGAGIGSNQRYAASSLRFDRRWIALRAGYTRAGRAFERTPVAGAAGVESDRENILLNLHPVQSLQLSVSRQNLLMQSGVSHTGASASLRARVNGLSAAVAGPAGFQLHASYFDSLSIESGQRRQGTTLGVMSRIGSRLDVTADLFQSRAAGYAASRFGVASLREKLTGRLTFSQTITHNTGGTTVSYGGQLSSNLVTVGLESQIVFLPFAPSGHSGFQQAMQVSVRLRLPRDANFNLSSSIDQLGATRYTAYATAYAYGDALDPGAHPHPVGAKVHLAKYVVRGRVVDAEGHGVFGASIRVGRDIVFTDSEGNFSSRQTQQKPYPLAVLLDEFMFAGVYELVSSPTVAGADIEEKAQAIAIVLRHLR